MTAYGHLWVRMWFKRWSEFASRGAAIECEVYREADKSLARPGRKQVNVSVRMAWISFGALPCRKTKTWWQLASRCCWNRARPWHASELVSFLVWLRIYQHPGSYFCVFLQVVCNLGDTAFELHRSRVTGCDPVFVSSEGVKSLGKLALRNIGIGLMTKAVDLPHDKARSHSVAASGVTRGVWGVQSPPHPKFRRPSKIVANTTRLWQLLKIAEFRTPTPQDVRKKGSKVLKLPGFAIVLY